MPDPVDSPGSSGSSSFNPYTTPGHDDQPSSALNRTTEHLPSNHGHQPPQSGHSQRGSLDRVPESDSMERYRLGMLEGAGKHTDEAHRKRKRSSTPNDSGHAARLGFQHQEDVPPFLGTGNVGSDARGRIDADFQGRKRPRPIGSSDSDSMSPDGMHPGMSYDKSTLPGELWQHIFTFLPPESLGSLLLVNQAFKFLLTADDKQLLARSPSEGALNFQSANSIWSNGRKYFHPRMPRPLFNLTELEMWQLIRGSVCQYCGKSGSLASSTDLSPLDKSQPSDINVVWPFGVRSCGECLMEKTEKEMDLLFSSTLPSILLPALPFALFTSSMHFISSIALRGSQSSSNLNLTKYYFKPHIQAMKREFDDVKALGSATAEEWVKGLETNGKEKLADAARWEQWDMSGALKIIRMGRYHEPEGSFSHTPIKPEDKDSAMDAGSEGYSHMNNVKMEHNDSDVNGSSLHGYRLPPRPSPPSQQTLPSPSHQAAQPHRAERSLREVNEAKAGRRAEIERRCAELDPPISVGVLSHMESFSAAIQIPHPFTDRDWGILKPRLLAQREVAERREKERVKQSQVLHAKSEERRQQDAQWKEAKEALDREWDDAQKPIRDRMAAHADDIIREGWREGDAVTKEKSPKFAADVLIYVRDRFYSDLEQDDADARAAGKPIEEDPPNGPPKRKLILENMKFIFDTKIKPLTERHQKELFLCNGCDNNSKFYGFEGVVQHYAAKHTSVLSLGSVVVYWRAEWPEKPPFHPDPDAAKALFSSLSHHVPGPGFPGGPGAYVPGTDHGHQSGGPYGRGPYGGPYQYPTENYRAQSPSMNPFYAGQQGGYRYPPPQGYPPNGPFDPHGPPPPPSPMYGSQFPSHGYPGPYGPPDSRVPPPVPGSGYPQPPGPAPYGSPYPHPSRSAKLPGHPAMPGTPSPTSEPYQTQLDFTAKHARDVWNGTSGIRGLPNSVRIYVLIYNTVSKFRERFGNELTLSLFADCLNNHAQMKPVRNLNGLMCKTCSNKGEYGGFHSHHNSSRGSRKLYALPALASHFQSIHIERAKPIVNPQTGMATPGMDWKFDMIDLPDPSTVASLIHAPGMDELKLNLFAAAFPGVFPTPPVDSGPAPNMAEKHSWSREPKRQDRFRRAPAPPGSHGMIEGRRSGDGKSNIPSPPNRRGLEVAVDDFPRFVDSPMADMTKPADPPRENEYDPHKPAFIEPTRDRYGRVEDPRSRARLQSVIPEREINRHNLPPEQLYARGYDYGHQRTNPSFERESDLNPARAPDGHEISQRAPGPSYASAYLPRKEPTSEYVAGGSSGRPADLNSIKRDSPRSPAKNVSEDGEVGEEPSRTQDKPLEAEPTEEMTAAERFLNGLVPEDIEMYQPKEEEAQHHEVSNSRKPIGPPEHDNRRWHHGTNPAHISASNTRGTPVPGEPDNGWRQSPSAGRIYQDYASTHELRENGGLGTSRHMDERSPDPSDHHYGRKHPASQGPRPAVEHPSKRPSSRFDRYEAQRHTSRRPRSRSPSVRAAAPVDTAYYRERSPKVRTQQRPPVYSGHPDDYHERMAMDEDVTYARMPQQGQYQYVDDPRYVEQPYGAPVEYIPVRVGSRQPQGAGSYYIERPVQREIPKEYIDYGPDYQRPPLDDPYYRSHSQQIEDPPRHVRYR